MSQSYNSDDLINSIKLRINIPTNQNTFTEADLLTFANEEMSLAIVPSILSLHEDHFLFSIDTALVDNQVNYTIPPRAIGNKLYDLQLVDLNNNISEMFRTKVGDEPGHAFRDKYTYDLRANKVHLLSAVSDLVGSGSLRFWFYLKPAQLVPTDEVGVITAIDTGTGIVTLSAFPDAFVDSLKYDFYKGTSPHNVIAFEITPDSVDSGAVTITFDPDDLPADLEVGDHVAIKAQSCIPQIPSDLHVYLAQKTAERILESQGDSEGLAAAQKKSSEMEIRTGNLIDNRVEESPIKLVNKNGALMGTLRRLRRRRW